MLLGSSVPKKHGGGWDFRQTKRKGVRATDPCRPPFRTPFLFCLLSEVQLLDDGTVAVDIKFDKVGSGLKNAGLLLCVSNARVGADSFYGYEVSLSSDGKVITVGKHKNNWEHIMDVAVNCNPTEWNNLKASHKELNKAKRETARVYRLYRSVAQRLIDERRRMLRLCRLAKDCVTGHHSLTDALAALHARAHLDGQLKVFTLEDFVKNLKKNFSR